MWTLTNPSTAFFLTAHFCEEEHTYDWLMLWLSRRPEWQRSREFEATLRAFSQSPSSTNATAKSPADAEWEDAEREWERYNSTLNTSSRQTMHSSDIYTPPNTDEDPDPVPVDKPRSRIVFQPTYNTTHTLFFRGHYLHIKRSRHPESYSEMLSISVIARSNAILKQLVLQAKKEYEAECVHRIQIYLADAHGSWRWTDSRAKRPLGSIVLNPGVKEMLVEDTKDFLRSERWYMDRGIPFRRGYLLYGVPGSGKSSLIHALAGYLGLDIYVVSLSSSWMSDSTLTSLMGRVPSRCVVLLEDLDAAFTRSTNRDDDDELEELLNSMGEGKKSGSNSNSNGNGNSSSNNHSSSSSRRHRHSSKNDSLSSTNTLSLSGLLNALDGISASEGKSHSPLSFVELSFLRISLQVVSSSPPRIISTSSIRHSADLVAWTSGSSSKTPAKPKPRASSATSSSRTTTATTPTPPATIPTPAPRTPKSKPAGNANSKKP
jgi:chaperone BCS1